MSNDSSEPEIEATKPPIKGFPAAILSTLSVGAIYFILPSIAVLILFIYPHSLGWSVARMDNWINESVTAQFLYTLLTEVMTVAAVFGLVRLFHWKLKDIGLIKPKWYQPLWGIAAAIPYYLLYIAMVLVVSALVPGFNSDQAQEIGFNSVHGPAALTLTFISLVILPPLAEEITMRGFLYTGLRKWLPRIVAALLVSSLFGAAHLAEGGEAGLLWIGALDTFILSMVLIFLREKTGNLWAGITLHATKNLVAFISLFIVAGR